MRRRKFLLDLGGIAISCLGLDGLALADNKAFDFSPQQQGRVRAPGNHVAQRLARDYRFVTPDTLTVAVSPFGPPIATYATDARTVIGSDPDYARLLADALGLKLVLVPVAWPDWPLGLASGKYDAVISNVGVTEQRKQKFDFATYRLGLLGFYVATSSPIQSIRAPKDVAGLRIITASGTIQERVLLQWNQQNVAQHLKPAELQFFDDFSSAELALLSGRADAIFNPHAQLSYTAATQGKIRQVGTLNAGWASKVDVAVAVALRKGSGLTAALTEATNGLIAGGEYKTALARWGLEDEAIQRSQTNPPGYQDA
jgi:polar amino acid transport system substrate-binding protein